MEQPDAYRKQCVRMAFNIVNKNNTWQSIDCESSNMTDLLVCQNTTFTHKTTDGMSHLIIVLADHKKCQFRSSNTRTLLNNLTSLYKFII